MRIGSEDYPSFTDINRKLADLYGACLTSDISKYGKYSVIDISIATIDDDFAPNNENILKQCSDLIISLITKSLINTNKLSKSKLLNEKQFLRDTIETEIDDKQTYSILKCRDLICKDEKYNIKKYGYVEEIDDIDIKAVYNAYEKLLNNSQIEIMCIGKKDPRFLINDYEKIFTENGYISQNIDNILKSERNLNFTAQKEKIDIFQSKLVLGFDVSKVKTESELFAARLFTMILGDDSKSKLFKRLREKLNLCYYCNAQIDALAKYMLIDCGIDKENKDIAVEKILKEIDICKNGGITQKDLNETIIAIKSSLNGVEDSFDLTEDWYIMQLMNGKILTTDEIINKYEKISLKEIIDVIPKFELKAEYFLENN